MKKDFRKILKNERGIALMLAITTITVVALLTSELVYETSVYQRLVYNTVDNMRAKYLARGALKLGRLQVHAANKALKKIQDIGKNSPVKETDVNQIYDTPLILPPPLPPGAPLIAKSALEKFNEDLGIQGGQISVKIVGESSKLNLNRLIWFAENKTKPKDNDDKDNNNKNDDDDDGGGNPDDDQGAEDQNEEGKTPEEIEEERRKKIEAFRSTVSETLQALMDKKFEDDEDFADKYDGITADELVGNILAWVDEKTNVDGEGAPKQGFYLDHDPPYAIKNAPLFSMSELYMVKGFDDQLVEFVSEHFTAALTDGINVNKINDQLIQALFPNMDEDLLDRFKEHREEVGFAKIEDFWKYMQDELGFTPDDKDEVEQRGLTLTTKETAFRVLIEAKSGDARRVWVAQLGAEPPDLSPPKQQEQPKPINPDEDKGGDNDDNKKEDDKKTDTKNDNDAPPIVYLRTD